MIDIHTHLHFSDYDNDRDEVVRRALEAGVKKMICVGTSPEDHQKAIDVVGKYEDVWTAVGIHPHYFNELRIANDELRKISEKLKNVIVTNRKKIIAIGECGLDYFSRDLKKIITEEQKARQKEGFIAQVELAEELKLPLIIHTRSSAGTADAYEDLYSILKSKILNLKSVVLHCYQGDTKITKKFLELPNVYFSFAGNVTYPVKKALAGTKNDLQETLKIVPLERLFVETDCPYLAPGGKRGERNEPSYIWMTAEKICEVKGIEMATLETALEENFQRVFMSHKA